MKLSSVEKINFIYVGFYLAEGEGTHLLVFHGIEGSEVGGDHDCVGDEEHDDHDTYEEGREGSEDPEDHDTGLD